MLGTDDDTEVHTLAQGTIPAFYRGYPFQDYRVEPHGGGVWKVIARYGNDQPKDENVIDVSFDTSGGTHKITQSLETVASAGITSILAPDFKKAIGVNGDAVEGVDIHVPIFNFQEKHYFANLSWSYLGMLHNITAKTNNDTFRGYPAGEVLFLGAAGSRRGVEMWEVTYKFACSPNKNNITIDTVMVDKKGWEYLWVRYVDSEANGTLVKQPAAVYVEKVYEEADFALLGIGGNGTLLGDA